MYHWTEVQLMICLECRQQIVDGHDVLNSAGEPVFVTIDASDNRCWAHPVWRKCELCRYHVPRRWIIKCTERLEV